MTDIVTGLTAAAMEEIKDATIVGASVVGNDLILTKQDGSTIDAGNVRGPKGDTGPASVALTAWPIGSIFLAVTATSPATLLGGGTWVAWGTGKVPVAVDTSQTEFNTVEKSGGEKKHTLITAELPSHEHVVGMHNDGSVISGNIQSGTTGNTYSFHSSGTTGTMSAGGGDGESHPTGSDTAHNNLQPYITCYMWKRTA